MTSWARSFWNGGRPKLLSPFGNKPYLPKVSEDDYSYITDAEITSPGRTYDPSKKPPASTELETKQDVLYLKGENLYFPVRFPINSIDEGKLRIQDILDRLATILNLPSGRKCDIQLFYKGHQLNDELTTCRDYGLKNESCVDFMMNDMPNYSDKSENSSENFTGAKKRRKRGSKGKKAAIRKKENDISEQNTVHETDSDKPVEKIQSPEQKLSALSNQFHSQIAPLCIQFIKSTPNDEKKKEYEYKRLTETSMNLMLQIDAVASEGNDETRKMRKALIHEVQDLMNELDTANKK